MIYLADTNVLLRFADRNHPAHGMIRAAVRRLRMDGYRGRTTTQNCIEFWNVLTRPQERNGWGLTIAETNQWLRLLERIFPLLEDSPAVYPEWRRLVVDFCVSGVQVHDARLVAAMNVYGVKHVLTLNHRDFARFSREGIVTLEPTTIVAS